MPRRLTSRSTLDNLKTEARRRLKALRATDPDATLRAAQHATALDYGFAGWPELKAELEDIALGRLTPDARADAMLRHCWEGEIAAARRILARHPDVARHSLATAIVCGELAEVRVRLADDPAAARAKAGPFAWEPLLYLAFGRTGLAAATDNALAVASALLDAGADPNAEFNDGWENPFKVLTGVIGHGEGGRPEHPRAVELAALLIDRGADPFDTQALYDTSIADDDPAWTERLWRACAAQGGASRWTEVPPPRGLGGRHRLSAIDYLLGNAVTYGHVRRAEWLVAHGADPGGINSYSGRRHHTEAVLAGDEAMAALLVRLGARPEALAGVAAFQAAAMRGDADEVSAIARRDPLVLRDPGPLIAAAAHGRADVVALLLAAGVAADLAQPDGRRALHSAASSGSIETARRLLDAGAEVDARGTPYDATPLSFAFYFGHPAMVDHLARLSRDVFTLAQAGKLERLGEVLASDPALANARRRSGRTPLHHLPDDDDEAAAVTRLLLAHGADVRVADEHGETPEQAARSRGLDEAADLMRAAG